MTTILITGLPGSGKSTLARELSSRTLVSGKVLCLNGDAIRKDYDDWDFSYAGRLRQAKRLKTLSELFLEIDSKNRLTVIDMVAPTEEIRELITPDYIIWMNTISKSIYEDTNKLYSPPTSPDFVCTSMNYLQNSDLIVLDLHGKTLI